MADTVIYRDTVTIVTPGTTTDYGQDVVDWSTATSADCAAWVGPSSTSEALADGDKTTTHLTCHLPAGAVVTAGCRITWRGDTYDVDGAPLPHSRRGALHHYELALKRVEG